MKNRATTLPEGAAERKATPIASGVLDYFPDAIVAIAQLSFIGNEQHNPGQPLHWDRAKSTDEADALMRHFLARGTVDTDGVRHSAKLAWRGLALLQKEIEAETAVEKALEALPVTSVTCFVSGPYGYGCTRPHGHPGEHWATEEYEPGEVPQGMVLARWSASAEGQKKGQPEG